jgi:hypothetical protein
MAGISRRCRSPGGSSASTAFDDPTRPWHQSGFEIHGDRFYFTVGDRQSDVQPVNAGKYIDEEVRTIKIRIRRAAKARKVALPDPHEFVELMARVRKRGK